MLCCVCGVLGHLAPVHRCARSVRCFACAVSWATVLLFTGAAAWFVVLHVRCPGPLGSCSPVCPLGALLCLCGVPGHLAPVHWYARVVCCVACAVSGATWLLFTGVPARCVALRVRSPGPLGSCSPVCPRGLWCCVCGVLGHLASVHRCARSVRCFACAVSWATWLLFTDVFAWFVVLHVRCPGPLGSCSPVCPLGALLCLCGVLGHLAPVHRCARSVCCVVCAVSWATWLLFTGVPARCVALRVRCPGPLGSCSPVCPRGLWCCVCGVLSHLASVHRCARSVRCFACAVSWATWLLFTSVPAWFVVLHVRCPRRLDSCSPVCSLGVLCCVCGVLGHLAPVHQCARCVRSFPCAVSWATWLLFTDVFAWFVVLHVRCPGPLGSCSPVCPLGALLCLCGVLGHLAPVHRCARSVCCVVCAVSWATWLLFTGVPARCVALRVRCPGPLGSCSPVCPRGLWCCVCGVLSHLASVHRCARSVRCFACAVSWATWLLFTSVPAWFVVLHVRCPRRLDSCSSVCSLGVLCCVCGVLGHLAPVHQCARCVRSFPCAVPWATWHLFTGVPARCVALRVRCPGPLGCCSPVCRLGALLCVCGVLGHLAPVHRCVRVVCCVACAVSWATWLLFTGVPARCFALLVRCPRPVCSCSPVCLLGVLRCVCGVLGHLAPVHRCARSVRCFACALSWATWLLFTGVPAWFDVLRVWCPGPLGSSSPVCPTVRCFACAVSWATSLLFTRVPALLVVLRVRCPGPLGSCSPVCGFRVFFWLLRCPGPFGSCSPVCPLGVLLCVCGVLGHLAPVHRCSRLVRCFACAVSWATWLFLTGVPARCVVLLVRCPRPLGSCSTVWPLGVLCCVCGVLGHLAPVHRCARSVCCVVCAVSWAPWLLLTGVLARCVVPWVACAGRRCGAHTRPSGRRLLVAGRGWLPSGRAVVHPDGGCS